MTTVGYRLQGMFAVSLVLAASWALAEGVAAADAAPMTWQTLAVSALAVISGWLQWQAKRAQATASRTLSHIEEAIDRLTEQLRAQGERLARLEGENAARFGLMHRDGR